MTLSERAETHAFEHVWVFAGGEFDQVDIEHLLSLESSEGYLAVDSGLEHCLAAGIIPSMIIGDFDSASSETLTDSRLADVPRYTYPANKDASDLQLALNLLIEVSPSRVTLVGVSGGRTDHMLFNWMLPVLQDWPFDIDLIDSSVRAFVVTAQRSLEFSTEAGQTLSMLALVECDGISVSGVEYPLEQARLLCGSTLGLSNRATGNLLKVSVARGKCLVMLSVNCT